LFLLNNRSDDLFLNTKTACRL